MAVSAETLTTEELERQRLLTDVDNLIAARQPDGSYPLGALDDVGQNLETAVQEGAQPFAVTRTEHQVGFDETTGERTFFWMGRSAVQLAMSGKSFHKHPNALRRVDVETDEARFISESLRPGMATVFISPRMSDKDATSEQAKEEHLGDDDAIRVSWLADSDDQQSANRITSSLLVRHVPLEAWVALLRDEHNIFGKSIAIEDEDSALSVMQAHRQLSLPLEQLPRGPVSIIEAVVDYIEDPVLQSNVLSQIERYYDDQELMKQQAAFKAERWLEFECELADSLIDGQATQDIVSFIGSMQHEWSDDELEIIERHHAGDFRFRMSRELAAMLEKLKRYQVIVSSAVLNGNDAVVQQLSPDTYQKLHDREQAIFMAYSNGMEYRMLEMQTAQMVSSLGISAGGGCLGAASRAGRGEVGRDGGEASGAAIEQDWTGDKKGRKWAKGICQIKTCPSRPKTTEVGPCSICKGCQDCFDRGEDPTKKTATIEAREAPEATQFIKEVLERISREQDPASSTI